MAGVLELIWVGGEAEYFSRRGWTAKMTDLPVGQITTAGTDGVATTLPIGEDSHQPKRPLVTGRIVADVLGICLEVANA
jgi:hypothetical protein